LLAIAESCFQPHRRCCSRSRMMTREEREWMDQLVMLIKAEKDPEKILVLVRELSNFLDQRELRLSHKSKSF
jgi:hypothetical protein